MQSFMPSFFGNHRLNIVLSTTFMGLLGFPVISPALPAVRTAFNLSTQDVGLVMAIYALPAMICVPLFGFWADRYGKKLVLVPALIFFSIAGGACALASSPEMLYLLRFIQGIGASALSSINVALVGDLFARSERARVMGHVGATQNVGSGLLPVLGGGLAAIGWFYPFFVPLLGLPVGLYLIIHLHDRPSPQRRTGRDFLGHAAHHLLDRRLLELVFLTGGFIFVGFGAFVTYLPIFIKDTFATGEFLIGFLMAARALTGTVVASQFGRLTRRFSYRSLVFTAFLALAAGMALVPLVPYDWVIFVSAMFYGGAFGILRTSVQVLVLNNAPEDLRATFAAANSFALRLAQTLAPLAAGFFLTYAGFTWFYFSAALIALAMAVLSLGAKSLRPEETAGG